jgi:flagellar hook assembly protein FlgD
MRRQPRLDRCSMVLLVLLVAQSVWAPLPVAGQTPTSTPPGTPAAHSAAGSTATPTSSLATTPTPTVTISPTVVLSGTASSTATLTTTPPPSASVSPSPTNAVLTLTGTQGTATQIPSPSLSATSTATPAAGAPAVALSSTTPTPTSGVPTISQVQDSPDSFSPDGDGQLDNTTISFTLSKAARITLTIRDSNHAVIRTLLNGANRDSGFNQAVWDGKDDGGSVPPDGLYRYVIEAVDSLNGRAEPAEGSVLIDTRSPLLLISPMAGSVLTGPSTFSARGRPEYTYFTCCNSGPTLSLVTVGSAPFASSQSIGQLVFQVDGSWKLVWDSLSAPDGSYELRANVAYVDTRGSYRDVLVRLGTFTVDNGLRITQVSDGPDSFSPNGDNHQEETTIRYQLSRPAKVTLRIWNANGVIVRSLLSAVDRTTSAQFEPWDGKSDQQVTVPDGVYRYTIDAEDPQGEATATQEGTVMVDTRRPLSLTAPTPGSEVSGSVTFRLVGVPDYTYGFCCSSLSLSSPMLGPLSMGQPTRQPDGSWQLLWNSAQVTDGSYAVRADVTYTDSRGSLKSLSVVLGDLHVRNGIFLTAVSDTPDSFSPDGDGQYDSTAIRYTLAKDAKVTIRIASASSQVVRTLLNQANRAMGSREESWDGLTDDGVIVPDGLYRYTIDAQDLAGNLAVPQSGTVVVDTRPPARLVSPSAGTVLTGPVTFIVGVESDYAYSGCCGIFLYRGVPGTALTSGATQLGEVQAHADGSWHLLWDTARGSNGPFELRAQVAYTDSRGMPKFSWVRLGTFTVDNGLAIGSPADNPDSFSPDGDGHYDSTTIEFILSRDARVTLRILDAGGTVIRTLLDRAQRSSGLQSGVWDGKHHDGTVVPDGLYTYSIDAEDAQGNRAVTRTGTVLVDRRPPFTLTSPTVGSTVSGTITVVATQPAEFTDYSPCCDWPLVVLRVPGQSPSSPEIRVGTLVRQSDGTWRLNWDSTQAVNGIYQIGVAVSYRDSRGSFKSVFSILGTLTIDNGVIITQEGASPDSFSPDGDGQYDTTVIRYMLSKPSRVTVRLFSGATVVRTLVNQASRTGGQQQESWSGENDPGAAVGDGLYTYHIEAVDALGSTAAPRTGTVLVDRRPPLTLMSPSPGATLSGAVSFIASSISDYDYQSCCGDPLIMFAPPGSPLQTSWGPSVALMRQTDGTWRGSLDTAAVSNGAHELRGRATYLDSRGANKSQWVPLGAVTIDNGMVITQVDDTPHPFSPDGDGQQDTSTIFYTLSKEARVNLTILDANNVTVRALTVNAQRMAGQRSEPWDGRNAAGAIVPDGVYRYRIEATDSLGQAAVPQTGTTRVDNRQPLTIISPAVGSELAGNVMFLARGVEGFQYRGCCPPSLSLASPGSPLTFGGQAIGTMLEQPDGSWRLGWDSTQLSNGSYELRASLFFADDWGDIRQGFVRLGLYTLNNRVTITQVANNPDSFSPDGDSQYESTSVEFRLSRDARVTLQILDLSGGLVRTVLSLQQRSAGHHHVSWDGRNQHGAFVSDGVYTYTLNAEDSDGNQADTRQGSVLVDTRRPLTLEYPSNGAVLNGTVLFTASQPSDYFLPGASLGPDLILGTPGQFGYGTNGRTIGRWIRQPDGTWQLAWNSTGVVNGLYELRSSVSYVDSRGDSKSQWVTHGSVVVDNPLLISQVADSPDSFSPNGDGQYDQLSVSYVLSKAAIVSIRIRNSSQAIVRTLVTDQARMGGSQVELWDGRSGQGTLVPDGIYTYTIEALDNLGGAATPREGTVLVDTRAPLLLTSPSAGSVLAGVVTFLVQGQSGYSGYFGDCCGGPNLFLAPAGASLTSGGTFMGTMTQTGEQALRLVWDSSGVPNGTYDLRIRVRYTDSRLDIKVLWVSFGTFVVQNANRLSGSVTDQRTPDSVLGHQLSLSVSFFPTAMAGQSAEGPAPAFVREVQTDQFGAFTVTDVPSGTYRLRVKHWQSVSTERQSLAFGAGNTVVASFGLQRAGDANNDDRVSSADFTELKTRFGQPTDCAGIGPSAGPCPDFDANGQVSASDFSLLKQSFGLVGPTAAS